MAALVQLLSSVHGLMPQAQVLKLLYEREGAFFRIDAHTVSAKLESIVLRAGEYRQWAVVRLCSALLGKLVDSLAPSVTAVLVKGKQVNIAIYIYIYIVEEGLDGHGLL